MGVGSGSALCTWLSAADLTQMENFAIAFPLKNACSPPHLFSPFPITKPSPGCSLEPTPMTPPAAQPCANTRGTTQARLLQLVAGHHPLLPLGVNWFARLRKWEGQYVHLINLKMKYAALMEVAEQLNRIEPSASGKSQNNWNCKPQPLGSTAKWACASDFFLWTDSFPNSGLFQAWASPRQGSSGHQIHDKLHISETNLQFKMKTTVRKIDDSQGWVHGKGAKSWGATRIFPGQWFPGARGHAGLMIPINLDIWAPLPTQRPGQRSGSPPETFCWSRLKPRSSPFWQINGFHWRISLSSISFREGRRQELRFGLLLMSSWWPNSRCIYTPPTCGKPRKKDPSLELLRLSGQISAISALPVWEAEWKVLSHPSPASWPWRRTLCPAPARGSGSVETPLDIIIYGVLVTLETK